jgi:hypothetical protein
MLASGAHYAFDAASCSLHRQNAMSAFTAKHALLDKAQLHDLRHFTRGFEVSGIQLCF